MLWAEGGAGGRNPLTFLEKAGRRRHNTTKWATFSPLSRHTKKKSLLVSVLVIYTGWFFWVSAWWVIGRFRWRLKNGVLRTDFRGERGSGCRRPRPRGMAPEKSGRGPFFSPDGRTSRNWRCLGKSTRGRSKKPGTSGGGGVRACL
jgi:hypothetical protein